MTAPARLPGAALAVGAFCLTFLLGIGSASAIALWQQSSTATMTVKSGTWAPSVAVTCANVQGSATVNLTITPSETAASLSYSAKKVGQSYGLENPLDPSTTSLSVGLLTPAIIATGTGNRNITVRVTAGFASSSATAEVPLKVVGGGANINCG